MISMLGIANLIVVDALFCGFRDSAGRNPRIKKQEYFTAAVRRGALAGVVVVAVFALLALGMTLTNVATWGEFGTAAEKLLPPLGLYAGLVLVAMGGWAFGTLDVKAFSTVAILGPFTMLRPWLIAAAIGWAVLDASNAIRVFGALAMAVMIPLERGIALIRPKERLPIAL